MGFDVIEYNRLLVESRPLIYDFGWERWKKFAKDRMQKFGRRNC